MVCGQGWCQVVSGCVGSACWFAELGRNVLLVERDHATTRGLHDAFACVVIHDLQIGADGQVPDADEHRLNAAEFVEVHDLEVLRIGEVLIGVDVADDAPPIVRSVLGLLPHHPLNLTGSREHVRRGKRCAGLGDEFNVLVHEPAFSVSVRRRGEGSVSTSPRDTTNIPRIAA